MTKYAGEVDSRFRENDEENPVMYKYAIQKVDSRPRSGSRAGSVRE